jgi:asparagine synthase (glutamine-hydrolysing)
MCGIAGVLHLKEGAAVSLETLEQMIAVMHHRGPDEQGFYVDDRVGLGQSRLSIIDLSSGTQPIHNEGENLWIVYNGEVFNYPELREDLEKKGHRFYTQSDTEVILHLYEERGSDCPLELNGQFAFAIWDANRKELFLARDRLGIRPLHYTVCGNSFLFASEIKSIFTVEGVPREIDPIALDQIFTFWATLPGRSFFRNIRELPPGHWLRISRSGMHVEKYWEIPFYPKDEQTQLSKADVTERIEELLSDAVRIRLRADVPVGTYLSGGLDSSGITALVLRKFDQDVSTFGIRFEEDGFDEGEHQHTMVSFLGSRHSELVARNEMIGTALPKVLWHCEKPVLRTSPVPLFLLSRLVRDSHLKVVLTGEGADEFFGGYNIFREAKVRQYWARRPDSGRGSALLGRLYPYIFKNERLRKTLQGFFARGLDRPDDPLFSHRIRWDNTSKTKTFFSEALRAEIGGYDGYEEVLQNLPAAYPEWDCLAKAQFLEASIFLSSYLLSSQGDRVAMAHSVEIRLPYLDPRILEFMGRVPSKWKVRGLDEKHILKKSFEGTLPPDITGRPKHPYRAPIKQALLHRKGTGYVKESLSERSLRRAGLFDCDKVARLVRKLEATDDPSEINGMALVGILTSQLIHHDFIEGFPGSHARHVKPCMVIDKRTRP